jgi:hypothetical protein
MGKNLVQSNITTPIFGIYKEFNLFVVISAINLLGPTICIQNAVIRLEPYMTQLY